KFNGPDWLGSERYDIVAKLPPNSSRDQIPLMLQTLLAERFKLTLHREKKVMPVYALVAGKNGSKLHPADTAAGLRISMGPNGRQLNGKVSISQLADTLSNFMEPGSRCDRDQGRVRYRPAVGTGREPTRSGVH